MLISKILVNNLHVTVYKNNKTLKKIFILVLLLSSYFIGFSQDKLRVNILNPPTKIKPGTFFTLFYEISDNNPLDKLLSATLDLPSNWQVLIKKNPEIIQGQTSVKYIYTVSIPSLAPSGEYKIGFKVLLNGIQQANKELQVEILKVRKIEILTINKPESVKEGDTLRLTYLVQNFGNNAEKLKVETTRGKFENLKDTLAIKPNESIKINTIQIVPTSESNNSWYGSSDLKIFLQDSLNPITSIISYSVYSTKNKKTDLYLRFPIEAGIWYNFYHNNTQNGMAYQYDLRGKGYLDFAQKHHLDFVIHGPNQFNIPAIGSYDQYSIDYNYKKTLNIKLGDYALRFNNLMEFGRFGRGARIDKEFKKTGFTAFFVSPRFYPNQRETFGGAFRVKPTQNLTLSLNYMSKYNLIRDRFFWSNFIGVSSLFHTQKVSIETELVGSYAEKKYDFGVFNRFLLQIKRIQFNSDIIYTGKNFYGFYNNSWLLVNSINFYLTKKISIGATNNITRLNPSLDLLVFNTSPYYMNNLVNLNYQINTKQRINLSYNQQEKEDRSPLKKFHFNENFARLAYYITTPKFQLWYDGRYGYAENLLTKSDTSGRQFSISNMIQPQVRIFPWVWLGGYFEYQRTNKFSLNNQVTNYYFYGGSVRFNFNNKLNAYFSYRNNFAPDELIEQRSFMDASLNLDLKRHRLSFTGGRAFIPNFTQTDQNTLYFVVKYTLKINTPITKNKRVGNISGNVLGLSKDINRSGILIQLGDKKFMTDSSGKFYFNNLIPDKYYITLHQSSIKSGVVTTSKLPFEVNVKADSSHKVEIKLVKSGGIIGKVNYQNGEQIASIDLKKDKPLVLAKLSNDKESFVTQVNAKNEFSFKEMKPGNWQLRLWVPSKENQFVIDNAEQSFNIEAEKIKELFFTVKPVERKIYFSSNNFNLVAKKSEPKKEEKKKDEVKVEPISKLKTKADSLNATSDIKKVKKEESQKPEKTVQNARKTFDKVSVKTIRSKRKVVYLPSNSQNSWKMIQTKIVMQKAIPNLNENSTLIETGQYTYPNTVEINSSDIEPNRELKNREKDRK